MFACYCGFSTEQLDLLKNSWKYRIHFFVKISLLINYFHCHRIFSKEQYDWLVEKIMIILSSFFKFFMNLCDEQLRGRSQTTFTNFDYFWPPTPLRLDFLWYKSLQKVYFFDHLPPSSCKRSLWTPPKQ